MTEIEIGDIVVASIDNSRMIFEVTLVKANTFDAVLLENGEYVGRAVDVLKSDIVGIMHKYPFEKELVE